MIASLLWSLGLFFSILGDLNNTVVRMISMHPPISNSSSSFSKLFETVRCAPIIIGITVTLKFYIFLSSRARSKYSSLFCFLIFTLWSTVIPFFEIFLLIVTTSGLLSGITWLVCISKSLKILCVLFFRAYSGLCMHHLVVLSDFNSLYCSKWVIFPTQFCLVLY